MCAPVVVNKYRDEYDVYIGRGSMWGNPIPIDDDNPRWIVIERYREYLLDQLSTGVITVQDFLDLKGKRLGCFCKPKDCHGDVIVEIYNTIVEMQNANR